MASCFLKMISCNSVRKELFALFLEFPRTVFLLHPLPRATFRFVPPSILPWAELFWPFRLGKNAIHDLCIKSNSLGEAGRGFIIFECSFPRQPIQPARWSRASFRLPLQRLLCPHLRAVPSVFGYSIPVRKAGRIFL
jgi:hypothetical protein